MREKKGLSTVVTTLIIVLLVLAAIGIIWSPIKNLLTQSSESFDQTKCLTMDIQAKKVVANGGVAQTTCLDGDIGALGSCNVTRIESGSSTCVLGSAIGQCGDGDPTIGGTTYNVTLRRKVTGEASIGAKIIFFTTAGTASSAIDFVTLLTPDTPIVTKQVDASLADAVKVSVSPYYLDPNTNEKKLCENSNEFIFKY